MKTVQDLIDILATLPADSRVVIGKDFEGGYNDILDAAENRMAIDANVDSIHAGKHGLVIDAEDAEYYVSEHGSVIENAVVIY